MLEILIEAAGGSASRSRYDEVTSRRLSEERVRVPYPYPYGFIRNTRGDDGEAVDCYVLTPAALDVGSVVSGRPIGLLEQLESGEIDHKVLAALPGADPVLDQALHDEMRDFILALFEGHPTVTVEVGRMLGAEEAARFIHAHRV